MDALSSLSSFIATLRISKPLIIHSVVPSSSLVSCRATCTKVSLGDEDNLYKILSLSPKSATMDDIKRAYRSMALRYHPDVCHPSKKEESTRMLVRLNSAYETLSNPMLRQHYDSQLMMRMRSDDEDDCNWRRHRWQQQLADLKKRRSSSRSSWGSRMRAQNMQATN